MLPYSGNTERPLFQKKICQKLAEILYKSLTILKIMTKFHSEYGTQVRKHSAYFLFYRNCLIILLTLILIDFSAKSLDFLASIQFFPVTKLLRQFTCKFFQFLCISIATIAGKLSKMLGEPIEYKSVNFPVSSSTNVLETKTHNGITW